MRILAICGVCQAQYDVSGQRAGTSVRCRCGGMVVVPEARVHDANVVRCASCGAVRGQNADACNYCGAVFSLADKGWGSMCPACFCRLPVEAHFCVECGTRINPQQLPGLPTELKCPRCVKALQRRVMDKVELFDCASCAGMWLPVTVFDEICADREMTGKAKAAAVRQKRGRHTFELTENEQVKYIPCPICRNLMNRRNFASISGVIIDICKDCGVWLDNQELSRIIRFIEDGGLERSRQNEARRAPPKKNSRYAEDPAVVLAMARDFGQNSGSRPAQVDLTMPVLQVLEGVVRGFLR